MLANGFVLLTITFLTNFAAYPLHVESQNQLKERVKELECLYDISSLIARSETLSDLAPVICTRIEKAFQYPKLASASLSIDKKHYGKRSKGKQIELKQKLFYQDELIGHVSVCYPNHENNKLSFLKEEKQLLNKIALEITQFYEKLEANKTERILNEIVSRQERLTVLGEMTAGVAHELNTPLGNIIGFSEFILGKTKDPQIKHDADKIMQSAFHAREIVKKLMLFSCEIPQKLNYCLIESLINEAIDLLQPYLKEKQVAVNFEIKQEGIKAYIDKIQFTQVFFNLIKNAIQASEQGTKVNITLTENNDFASIIIEDFGTGIPTAIQNKIFDPFFTYNKNQEGNGLGLSVVHGIIKQHKGRIQFSSELNKGTTFVVSIPKAS